MSYAETRAYVETMQYRLENQNMTLDEMEVMFQGARFAMDPSYGYLDSSESLLDH